MYAGHRLDVMLRDPLAEGWYDHDWGPQIELDSLAVGRLRAGATVFDLGAHQGIVALVLGRIVGPGGQVVAVEPEPHNVAVAEENRLLNDGDNVTLLHAAISDRSGIVHFSEGLNGAILPGGRVGKVAVPAVTVDELAGRFGTPDVVFIDVEGFEGAALRGAQMTLAEGCTDFFVELHERATLTRCGTSADEVVDILADAGLTIRAARASDGVPTAEFVGLENGVHLMGSRCYLLAQACDPRPPHLPVGSHA
jgi:FkbM family methyltransferase